MVIQAYFIATVSCLDRHKQQCIIAILGLLELLVPCLSKAVASEASLQPEVCQEQNVDLLNISARTSINSTEAQHIAGLDMTDSCF